jgi:hypothetical protein
MSVLQRIMSIAPPLVKALMATALTGAPIGVTIEQHRISVEFPLGIVRCSLDVLSTAMIAKFIETIVVCDTVRVVTTVTTRVNSLLVMAALSSRTGLENLRLHFSDDADIVIREHVVQTIRNNQLKHITLQNVPQGDEDSLRDAIADHKTLVRFICVCGVLTPASAITIIDRNRSIKTLDYSWLRALNEAESAKLLCALRNNWVLTTFQSHNSLLNAKAHEIIDEHISLEEIHAMCAQLAIVLLPLESSGQLCPYEMLWIIDWLPPMSTRYAWAPDGVNVDYSYDPYHGKKIALISGIVRSYRQVLEDRI